MKKIKYFVLLIMMTLFSFALTGCVKPYMVPIFEEIESNETAFLVPLEGDSTNQAKIDSEQFLQASYRPIYTTWRKEGR